jgi:hypothetical protein
MRTIAGRCQCGQNTVMGLVNGNWQFVSHACAKRPLASQNGERQATSSGDEGTSQSGRPVPTFSNARKTMCVTQHLHASMMEAAVCNRLTYEYRADKLHRLVQQVRLPLLRLAESDGRLKYITVDFGVIHKSEEYPGLIRLIEAKNPKRVSRDWPARKRACELSWGLTIEEVSQ